MKTSKHKRGGASESDDNADISRKRYRGDCAPALLCGQDARVPITL